jgi:hypothetical protein
MNIDALFSGTPPLPGGTPGNEKPAAPTPAQGGKQSIDSLFGGGNGGEEKPTSPLAGSRSALPEAGQQVQRAREEEGGAPPPTPEDVQRNLVDLRGHTTSRERAKAFLSDLKGEKHLSDLITGREPGAPDPSNKRFGAQADVSREKIEQMTTGFAMGDVAGPAAGVKAAARAIDGVTNRAFGVSILDKFDTQVGAQVSSLSDKLYQLSKSAQGMKMQWMTDVKNYLPKDWKEHAEDIYHSFEDPGVKLSPRAQALKDKTVQPIMAKNAKMREQLRELGVNVGPEVENYIERVPVKSSSLIDTLRTNMPVGRPKGISTFAPELQSRKIFEMQGTSGEKDLHFVQNSGNTYSVWRNQEKLGGGKFTAEELENKQITFEGEKYNLATGTTKNIEKHAPFQYYHDPLLSAIQGNINLSEALTNAKFLENFKTSPEFRGSVIAPSKAAPEGFREVSIPQLKGYKFSPRVANVLDDFSGAGKGNDPLSKFNDITRVAVSSLFWNPLPHIMNVLDHKIVEGGLVGNLKALSIDLPSTVKTAIAAHREVTQMGPLYRKAVKEGAGLIYPSVALRDFSETMINKLGTAPEMGMVAKAWGYANPVNMVKAIYQHSAKSLWSWNDVIMMHAYMSHMAEGQALPTAIREVEKHIPNYRVPDQVMGSRLLGQSLQSPGVTAFGRYDYGRLASYGNMVKDLIGRDSSIGERAKALDQMAMLAVSSFIIYPAIDNLVRGITGNEHAGIRRFGAATVPEAIQKFAQGDSNWGMLMGTVMPLSPAMKVPVELATGRDTFTGKNIADEKLRYGMQQLAPTGQIYNAFMNPKKSATEVLANQMGINIPSEATIAARDRAKAREEKKRLKEEE